MGPSTIRMSYGRHAHFRKCVTVTIGDDISQQDVANVKDACVRAQRFGAAVDIHIDSIGGQAFCALDIADLLVAYSDRVPMRVVVTGNCFSAAIIILLSVPASCRHGLKDTRYMVHCTRIEDQRTDWTRNFDEAYINFIMRETKPNPEIAQAMKDFIRDGMNYYFSDSTAFLNGFIW